MISRGEDHFDVRGLDGAPMCRFCGELPPDLDGRFCSRYCRARWGHLAADPSPDQIRERAAAIRDAWPEWRRRQAQRDEQQGTAAIVRLYRLLYSARVIRSEQIEMPR